MRYLMLALVLTPALAYAECKNVQRCDSMNGNCQVEQLCENSYDPPAYNLAPLPPVINPGVQPINPPTVPPIGTTDCRMQNINGQWKQVCQ